MTAVPSRIVFVPSADGLASRSPGELTIVLDPGWVAGPDDRWVRSTLPAFSAVVEHHDLFAEALTLVDAWAEAADVADRFMVEGVSYWFRLRETMWHWVHERLLWRYALESIGVDDGLTPMSIPWTEAGLLDVAKALGGPVEIVEPPQATVVSPRASLRGRLVRLLPAVVRQAYRRWRPHPDTLRMEQEREAQRPRDAFLAARLDNIARLGSNRILVVSTPSAYQRIGGDGDRAGEDPNLSSVLPALQSAGMEPITIGSDMGRHAAELWPLIAGTPRLLPDYFVEARWALPDDAARATAEAQRVLEELEAVAGIPFRIHGVDIAEPFLEALRAAANTTIRADVRQFAWIERMVAELCPRAVLMTHEGHRIPWITVAARRGLPTFAVQHGVLYAAHPGYPDRRDPRVLLPSCTFVYGHYERRALEAIGYLPHEIVVSGSPRLDLYLEPLDAASAAADRALVRNQLGVAEDNRVLVVSTNYLQLIRRAHLAHMIATLLGGPLPGVHVVFKQHPGERDEGPYASLLTGLACSGGYDRPPMSVIRDIDLYQLLTAADAHLGHHSTVLTDAVVAGTCNLIADVQASPHPVNYFEAGVAWPVRDVADVRVALRDLPTPTDEAREGFLADHFRAGDAAGRIATVIAKAVGILTN